MSKPVPQNQEAEPKVPDPRPIGGLSQAISLVRPREHGSWSLALEPLALGLIAAPSWAGAALAFSVLAGFFLRRPLKIVASPKAPPERRALAAITAMVLATLIGPGLLAAGILASLDRLWPLLLAIPPGILFFIFDRNNAGRETAAELTGTTAFGFVPAAIAMLAGWPAIPAFTLTGAILARSIPTVLTVRTYLRARKGQSVSRFVPVLAATIALLLTIGLGLQRLTPYAAAVFTLLFLVRTLIYLSPQGPKVRARTFGIQEMILGVLYVITIGLLWPA